MKSFRTELTVRPTPHRLALSSPVITTGSCFSDSIGNLLSEHKFKTTVNPLGTIYNPVSIHKALLHAVHNQPPAPQTYLERHGIWSNYDFHSYFSGFTKHEVQTNLTNAIGVVHHFMKDARLLIITYGTAWVYERINTGERVANCHKVPASEFNKKLLTVAEIKASFTEFLNTLKSFQPDLKIILTLSPVRHIRDTPELNSVSKAVLRVAAHQITEDHPEVEYFPAYEIMMDDLRDYRFYSSDMLHPSPEAIDYIWEKFSQSHFGPEVISFMHHWQSIRTAMNHAPFHPDGDAHMAFLSDTLSKLKALASVINVEEEIQQIQSRMALKEK